MGRTVRLSGSRPGFCAFLIVYYYERLFLGPLHGLFCSTYRQVLAEIKKHFKINFPDRMIYYNIYYVGQRFRGGVGCDDSARRGRRALRAAVGATKRPVKKPSAGVSRPQARNKMKSLFPRHVRGNNSLRGVSVELCAMGAQPRRRAQRNPSQKRCKASFLTHKGPEQYQDTAPALFGLLYFKYFFSFRATSCMSMGFARWSSMPHSRHLWMSSEKASAVMAMMGTSASARSSFRMAAVAA